MAGRLTGSAPAPVMSLSAPEITNARTAPLIRHPPRTVESGPAGKCRCMDHASAPLLEALVAYRERGDISFTPPGHKQGRGIDERVAAVLGREPFAADVMTMNGLDDR